MLEENQYAPRFPCYDALSSVEPVHTRASSKEVPLAPEPQGRST